MTNCHQYIIAEMTTTTSYRHFSVYRVPHKKWNLHAVCRSSNRTVFKTIRLDIAVKGSRAEQVFKCSKWPPFTAVIEANRFENCPIARCTVHNARTLYCFYGHPVCYQHIKGMQHKPTTKWQQNWTSKCKASEPNSSKTRHTGHTACHLHRVQKKVHPLTSGDIFGKFYLIFKFFYRRDQN